MTRLYPAPIPQMPSMHYGAVEIAVVRMTPEWAADLLTRNPKNRRIKAAHVELMARDMKAGQFQFNGDVIRIDTENNLLDGQNRLTACVRSKEPFDTLLIKGLPPDARATIDSGAKRSFGDRLQMEGVSNASAVSAALRLAAGFATGEGSLVKLSHQELAALFDIHSEGIGASVTKTLHCFHRVNTPIAAIHYIGTATGNAGRAEAWAGAWRSGIPDYPDCPVHRLRERLIAAYATTSTTGKINPRDANRLIVNAWNHFVLRRGLKAVKAPATISIPGWDEDTLWRRKGASE